MRFSDCRLVFLDPLPSFAYLLPAMPITKSAIKSARQSEVRNARRLPYKTRLKSMSRKFIDLVKEGKKPEAIAILPEVFKTIDLATKRNLIHKNNAARRKSRLSKMVK